MNNKRQQRTKDVAFDLAFKAFDESTGEVEGYASVFGNIDHVGDVIEHGAYTKTLQENAGKVRFLWQHDRREPIGVIKELREDAKGLYFRAEFAPTQRGQEARELLKMGAVGGFSIGYLVIQEEREQQEDGRFINRIKEIRLLEISEVTFPCNEECTSTGVKEEVLDELEALSEDELDMVRKFTAWLAEQREKEDEPAASIDDDLAPAEATADEVDDVEQVEAPENVNDDAEQLKAILDTLRLAALRDTLSRARKG